MKIPLIKSVMTPFPYSIEMDTSLESAKSMMKEHAIHHLPITDNRKLVGILSDKDMNTYLASNNHGKILSSITINDIKAYLPPPVIVDMNHSLMDVLAIMANNRLDVVIIVKGEKLVGIFTAMDACKHFSQFLRDRYSPPGPIDVA